MRNTFTRHALAAPLVAAGLCVAWLGYLPQQMTPNSASMALAGAAGGDTCDGGTCDTQCVGDNYGKCKAPASRTKICLNSVGGSGEGCDTGPTTAAPCLRASCKEEQRNK
jgi:hypothetical protein